MDLFLRFTLYLILLFGTVVGIGCTQPHWMAEMGLDFWNLLELKQVLAQSQERSDQLDVEREKVIENSQQKQQVIWQLLDQKISLIQAAQQIQEIEGEHQMEIALGVLGVAGTTQEERVCWAVIHWTEHQFFRQPEQATQIRTRLENELAEYFAAGSQ